jgi:hypothetical protein
MKRFGDALNECCGTAKQPDRNGSRSPLEDNEIDELEPERYEESRSAHGEYTARIHAQMLAPVMSPCNVDTATSRS